MNYSQPWWRGAALPCIDVDAEGSFQRERENLVLSTPNCCTCILQTRRGTSLYGTAVSSLPGCISDRLMLRLTFVEFLR